MDLIDMCVRDLKVMKDRCRNYRRARKFLSKDDDAKVRLIEKYITGMLVQIGEYDIGNMTQRGKQEDETT